MRVKIIIIGLAFFALAGLPLWADAPVQANSSAVPALLQFNRDIRPILSENCFFCHGQDPNHRKADRRLDTPEGAFTNNAGIIAIVPGSLTNSEVWRRISSTDEDEQMPPPKSNRHVSPEQIATIKRWILEGAKYEKHWAFVPPKRSPLPEVKDKKWVHNDVDRFILARLESEGLTPSPEATPSAWLRRVSFDLTGLAPTPAELDAFSADVAARGELAYSLTVDRLLASPHFGERLAQEWLDAARYADTQGFNNDTARTMWRWRDWVIDSFNDNKPYNQFLIEQLAGDLLPHPTLDQRIATGFQRNNVVNSEGGIIDEEYRASYVIDRVRTLGMSTLGLTLACCQCHDHKFDPLLQKDYYRFYAFFNQVPELGEDGRVFNAAPFMPAPTREQQARFGEIDSATAQKTVVLAKLRAADRKKRSNAEVVSQLKTQLASSIVKAPENAALWLGAGATANGKTELVNLANPKTKFSQTNVVTATEDTQLGTAFNFDAATRAALSTNVLNFDKPWSLATWVNWSGGEAVICSTMNLKGPASAAEYGQGIAVRIIADGRIELRRAKRWPAYSAQVLSHETISPGRWQHVAVTCDGTGKSAGMRIFINGVECAKEVRHDGCLTLAKNFEAGNGKFLIGEEDAPEPHRLNGQLADLRLYQSVLDPGVVQPWVETTLAQMFIQNKSAKEHADWLRDFLLRRIDADYARVSGERDDLLESRRAVERDVPTTMVMEEMSPPRVTHILRRGMYDAPGDVVTAGVPETLLGAWPKNAPTNRLGLALWLTKPDHPLTARVAVNRFWQQLFGVGIVKTSDDFGSQGEYPVHPELLDSLARDFIDGGWDTKAMFRKLVLSATYRQDSGTSPALLERDPENRLLARGPRVRLPAEEIRDHALAVSGLLKEKIGGPSVYPTQPVGLYKGVVVESDYPGTSWTDSTGDDLYRRSLYTFWKRTVPYPMLNTFDAPDREFCTVRRSRTDTPLQALTLMNEPSMVEAGRQFGLRMLREGGADDDARLTFGFRAATGRFPKPEELAVLSETLKHFRKDFGADETGARALTKSMSLFNEAPVIAEQAAYATVGGLLLNLDETITKN